MAFRAAGRQAGQSRTALFNDAKIRGWLYQIVVLAVVVYFAASAIDNMFTNLRAQHIASGFGFLHETAGFNISQTLIPYDEGVSTYGAVYLVGLANTLIVSVIGIVLATVLGFAVGIARLSANVILRWLATAYVEVFRDVPLLLHIFIWYFGILRLLPVPRASIRFGSWGLLNNRGLFVPRPEPGALLWVTAAALAVAVIAAVALMRWAGKRQSQTGRTFPRLRVAAGLVVGVPLIVFFLTGAPLHFDFPRLGTFRPNGGTTILPEFTALLLALSTYTAAFIAEIVRAGILSVSRGQTEASYALGLPPRIALRLVVIPQAMRVIVPPLTSELLNLTKNSSLAVAIAYPDLVSVFAGTALNQTGQAVEILLMTMLTYLALSLMTSALMNAYNARMALVER